jgi:hypothetical protein
VRSYGIGKPQAIQTAFGEAQDDAHPPYGIPDDPPPLLPLIWEHEQVPIAMLPPGGHLQSA